MKIKRVLIGLEIHVELKTKSKMFCGCSAESFGKEPNTQTCPTCLGLPGALPVPNKRAIEMAVLIGKALNCKTTLKSQFDRKNYFYPDLPKGYQISQHEYNLPFSTGGWVETKLKDRTKRIGIKRAHLEEDTGKSIHTEVQGEKVTLLDFNKSGIPLVEIVSEPDIESSEEAVFYCVKIRKIIKYLDFSDCDMEKGQMRFEPTINLLIDDGVKAFYTPLVEIKNINSFRFLRKALDYEIDRQFRQFSKDRAVKTSGNKTTRGYDQERMVTFEQRHKEEAEEYRYFPEPDIPPFEWSEDQLAVFSTQLSKVELPNIVEKRFKEKYGLTDEQTEILTEDKRLVRYFEETAKKLQNQKTKQQSLIKLLANFIVNKRVDLTKISPEKLAKMIIDETEKKALPPEKVIKIVQQVVEENRKAVEDYRRGRQGVIEFLLGQVMRQTKGTADPSQARKIIIMIVENLKK